MLFRHKNEPKNKFHIDLGDLQNEKENLTNFLQQHLKATVYDSGDRLAVDSEKVSISELHRTVDKFVYHKDLNTTHYVSVEGGTTVKINKFNKHDKKEAHKKERPHQTAVQSWGL